MIQLTDLGGNPIWVLKAWIQVIRGLLPDEYNTHEGSVLILSGEKQAVRESPKEVVEKINGNTG